MNLSFEQSKSQNLSVKGTFTFQLVIEKKKLQNSTIGHVNKLWKILVDQEKNLENISKLFSLSVKNH